jgi:hypothetical protein
MLKSNCNKYDLYQRKTQIGINDKTLFFCTLKAHSDEHNVSIHLQQKRRININFTNQ